MNDLAVLGELFQLAGHTVIEANTKGQQQIRLVNRIIRVNRSVHSQHVQRLGMSPWENAQTHHGHGNRNAGLQGELCEFFGRFALNAAATDVKNRSFRSTNGRQHLTHLFRSDLANFRTIAGQIHFRIKVDFVQRHHIQLNVFWNVDQNGARTTCRRDMKRLFHDPRDVANTRDHIVVLRDGSTNFDHRSFLEGVASNHRLRHLAGDGDQRDAVQLRIGNAGHQVSGTWAACGHAHAHFASGPSNALSSKTAALFMARQNCANLFTLFAQCLMERHAASARIGVNCVGSESDEHLDQNLSPIDGLSRFFDGSQRRHPCS